VRHLWLLRHAKSSWSDADVDDHDRPLAARGVEGAGRIADHLDATGVRPDLVLCSSALRARQTLSLVLPALGTELTVSIEPRLYSFGSETVLSRLTEVPDDAEGVLVVGHNPATQDLAIALSRSGDRLGALRAKYPTAGLAGLDLGVERWRDVAPGCAILRSFDTPASLS
jgi:phosphohistidine phosphatase